MASQDDDDLQLIRASSSLLQDLEQSLPRLLWKQKPNTHVHQLVRLRDLDYVLQLVRFGVRVSPVSYLTLSRLNPFNPSLNF